MKKSLIALSLAFACSFTTLAQAATTTEVSTQLSEAAVFFNQVLQETRNPYIANMAQESLNRLKSGEDLTTNAGSRQQVEVPLLTQLNKGLAVPVLLDKRVMGTFIVDTGATYTVITPRMAEKLGVYISPDAPRITILTANGAIKAPMATIPSVAIGSVEVRDVPVVIQELGTAAQISGLLGMTFFKDMDLTIKKNKLILSISHAPRTYTRTE